MTDSKPKQILNLKSKTKSKKSPKKVPKFFEGEKILCFHGSMLYEAKCLKISKSKSNEYLYYVHYNGWNKNWDEWVPSKRILKFNEENLKKQKDLTSQKKYSSKKLKTKQESPSSLNSNLPTPISKNQSPELSTQENNDQQIISFEFNLKSSKNLDSLNLSKKSKIIFPDELRQLLIDDYDFIIQQNKLVKLPCSRTVSSILNDYLEYRSGSNWEEEIELIDKEEDLNFEENVNGLIDFFNNMIGSQLLFKFERLQYSEISKANKPLSEIYGLIHLLRLFEKLNQITVCASWINQIQIDSLIYFINNFLKYLQKNIDIFLKEIEYFVAAPYYIRASL